MGAWWRTRCEAATERRRGRCRAVFAQPPPKAKPALAGEALAEGEELPDAPGDG